MHVSPVHHARCEGQGYWTGAWVSSWLWRKLGMCVHLWAVAQPLCCEELLSDIPQPISRAETAPFQRASVPRVRGRVHRRRWSRVASVHIVFLISTQYLAWGTDEPTGRDWGPQFGNVSEWPRLKEEALSCHWHRWQNSHWLRGEYEEAQQCWLLMSSPWFTLFSKDPFVLLSLALYSEWSDQFHAQGPHF